MKIVEHILKKSIRQSKWMMTLSIIVLPALLNAQDATTPASNPGFFESHPQLLLTLLIAMLAIVLVVLIFLANALVKISREMVEKETQKTVEVALFPFLKGSGLKGLWKKLNRAVPVTEEKDILFDHDYDGIRELDNQLPPWWKYLFYITILYAVVYFSIYHVFGIGKSSAEKYQASIEKAEKEAAEYRKQMAEDITPETVTVLKDEASLSEGKDIFLKNCLPCHGDKGQGIVGPNLTDQYWIHGGGIKNIFTTITNGVPEKGMISWKTQLSPKQIQKVASYVLSLQGTNPPNAKEPQGELWTEGETTPVDSVSTN